MKVVCISEELFKKLKELLGELSPLLVAEVSTPSEVASEVTSASMTTASMTARQMILSVLEPGKTYTREKILELVAEKYGVKIPVGTLDSLLSKLLKKRKLKRAKLGVYQLVT